MKKIPIPKKILLGLAFLLSSGLALADCCPDYECNVPLNCGCFGLQFQGGVYPTIWNGRGDYFSGLCNDCGFDLGELPKFSKFFGTPWIIGGQLHYAWSDHWDIYGELNYIQAGKKSTAVTTVLDPNIAILLGKYKAVSGYVGLRYYSCRWCDTTSLFVGAKIGFLHHRSINAHQLVGGVPSSDDRDFFRSNTSISGGANIGIDYLWCDCWSLVLTAEVVASKGPRGNACVQLTQAEDIQVGTALLISNVKTEVSFPITLGVRYNF